MLSWTLHDVQDPQHARPTRTASAMLDDIASNADAVLVGLAC